MPIPTPNPKEKQSTFIGRCVKTLAKTEKDRYFPKQRLAICYESWRENK